MIYDAGEFMGRNFRGEPAERDLDVLAIGQSGAAFPFGSAPIHSDHRQVEGKLISTKVPALNLLSM